MPTKKTAAPKAQPAPPPTTTEPTPPPRALFTKEIVARDGKTYRVGDLVPQGLEARYIERKCAAWAWEGE